MVLALAFAPRMFAKGKLRSFALRNVRAQLKLPFEVKIKKNKVNSSFRKTTAGSIGIIINKGGVPCSPQGTADCYGNDSML